MKTLLILFIPLFLLSQNVENPNNEQSENKTNSNEQNNIKVPDEKFSHFSFGAYYVPYSRSYMYGSSSYNSANFSIYQIEYNQSNMDAQFSYLFTRKFGVTFDLSYSSTYSKNYWEEYRETSYDTTNTGEVETDGLNTISFIINIKYYLFSSQSKKVSPYIQLGFGKQFSQYVDKTEELFNENENQNVTIEDNYEEFMSDLNSPYIFNIGFGAEYFFTKSFSVFSMIRFSYMFASAEYKYYRIYKNQDYSTITKRNRDRDISNTTTKVGLGLNFYF